MRVKLLQRRISGRSSRIWIASEVIIKKCWVKKVKKDLERGERLKLEDLE